jgi:competence protein ComEA
VEIYINLIKKYWYYIVITIVVISVSVILWYTNRDISTTFRSEVSQAVAQEQKSTCSMHIDVSGAVNNPNVYCLPDGSIIIDAIKKAGGFKKSVYAKEYIQSNINLAQKLEPNQKLYIPSKNEFKYNAYKYDLVPIVSISSKEEEDGSKDCVSINTATLEQLDLLKGVGPSLAQKIIDSRPYKQVEDLDNVSGIGEALFEGIKDSVCI